MPCEAHGKPAAFGLMSPDPSASAREAELRGHARDLRTHQTEAEERLWYHLRSRRFLGLKFRRQIPVGPYIADFICHEHRLIIEADGGQHADQAAYDHRRDQWLSRHGYKVLRFWNNAVLTETDAVLAQIRSAILAPEIGQKE